MNTIYHYFYLKRLNIIKKSKPGYMVTIIITTMVFLRGNEKTLNQLQRNTFTIY